MVPEIKSLGPSILEIYIISWQNFNDFSIKMNHLPKRTSSQASILDILSIRMLCSSLKYSVFRMDTLQKYMVFMGL